MKIVVNNETEKQYLECILHALVDCDAVGAMEDVLNELEPDERPGRAYINLFIEAFLLRYHVPIEVDSKEPHFEYEDGDFVSGKCRICGTWTMGVEDNVDLSVVEVDRLFSRKEQEDWLCDSCYRNNRCELCGEHYPDEQLDRSEDYPICTSCQANEEVSA